MWGGVKVLRQRKRRMRGWECRIMMTMSSMCDRRPYILSFLRMSPGWAAMKRQESRCTGGGGGLKAKSTFLSPCASSLRISAIRADTMSCAKRCAAAVSVRSIWFVHDIRMA
jgi:hypothetical protein